MKDSNRIGKETRTRRCRRRIGRGDPRAAGPRLAPRSSRRH